MKRPLTGVPSFDGRAVIYPSAREIRDYFAWRQADTHINNLYNTVFWALVQDGQTEHEAHETLKGTVSSDKHEMLFSRFGINYDKLPAFFRKGTTLVWVPEPPPPDRPARTKPRLHMRTLHVDIIGDDFWTEQHVAPAADVPTLPYWEQPSRLVGSGLGAHVMQVDAK